MPAIGIIIIVAAWIWFGALGSRAFMRSMKRIDPGPLNSIDLWFALFLLIIGPFSAFVALLMASYEWQQ